MRDDLPETPEWQGESRCCPFDNATCGVCSVAETDAHEVWLLGPNIVLGDS